MLGITTAVLSAIVEIWFSSPLCSLLQVAQSWVQTQDSYNHQNIQGNALTSKSNNGQYVILQKNRHECTLISNGGIASYIDKIGNVRSMAISNSGKSIISFDFIDPAVNLSVVRIFDAESFDTPVYNEVWIRNFGSGVSITPSANMVAIGSPDENAVYIFAMNEDDALVKSSRKMIKHHDKKGSLSGTFGTKVALSETGTSIAVASPSATVEDIEVGAVYIYTWVGNEWERSQYVLYGAGESRKLGIGGIAIDDANGQISVQNKIGQRQTFLVRIDL